MISILLLTCYVYADEFSMLINTEKVDWDKFEKKGYLYWRYMTVSSLCVHRNSEVLVNSHIFTFTKHI